MRDNIIPNEHIKYLEKLKLEVKELEQKKNKLFTTNNELRERKQQHTKRIEHLIQRLAKGEDLASILYCPFERRKPSLYSRRPPRFSASRFCRRLGARFH